MTAYDVGNNTIGSAQLTLASALDTLRITAPGIAYVTIDAGSTKFCDGRSGLRPQECRRRGPVPTLGEFALLLLGLMLAGVNVAPRAVLSAFRTPLSRAVIGAACQRQRQCFVSVRDSKG